jgi:hypothetical protein
MNPYIFASGSEKGIISFWDLRQPFQAVLTFMESSGNAFKIFKVFH